MSLRVSEVVFDCADHGAVVEFWAAALGYERREITDPEGNEFCVMGA